MIQILPKKVENTHGQEKNPLDQALNADLDPLTHDLQQHQILVQMTLCQNTSLDSLKDLDWILFTALDPEICYGSESPWQLIDMHKS